MQTPNKRHEKSQRTSHGVGTPRYIYLFNTHIPLSNVSGFTGIRELKNNINIRRFVAMKHYLGPGKRYTFFTWLKALDDFLEGRGSWTFWKWMNEQDNLRLGIDDIERTVHNGVVATTKGTARRSKGSREASGSKAYPERRYRAAQNRQWTLDGCGNA